MRSDVVRQGPMRSDEVNSTTETELVVFLASSDFQIMCWLSYLPQLFGGVI